MVNGFENLRRWHVLNLKIDWKHIKRDRRTKGKGWYNVDHDSMV